MHFCEEPRVAAIAGCFPVRGTQQVGVLGETGASPYGPKGGASARPGKVSQVSSTAQLQASDSFLPKTSGYSHLSASFSGCIVCWAEQHLCSMLFCQDMDLDLFVVKSESQKQRLANSTGHMFKSWCQTLCLKVCYGCLFACFLRTIDIAFSCRACIFCGMDFVV